MAQPGHVVMRPARAQRREMTGQRRRIARQVDKDEIVPGLAADALQPHPRAVDAGAVMVVGTAEAGRADQAAVEPVGPGIITAEQHRPALLRLGPELHAAMPAYTVEGADASLLILAVEHPQLLTSFMPPTVALRS